MATKPPYTQEELIALLRNRDQKAFSYLYDSYSRALFGVINRVVQNQEEAEDVLQRCFLKIWDNFDSYDAEKGRLYTWMLKIARNASIDSARSRHEKMRPLIRSTSTNVYTFENDLKTEDNAHDNIGLRSILNDLKEEQKKIIDLAYFEGYTQEEISKQLQIPLGTIKSKVRQALLRLRELTKKEIIN